MQAVTIVCVGKLKEGYWRDAAVEYQKRLSAFCRLSTVEIEEERLPQNPSAAQIAAGLEAEGRRSLSKIAADSVVVALCIEGKLQSSEELARMLDLSLIHIYQTGIRRCYHRSHVYYELYRGQRLA